jgi:hypothetical protein
MAGSISRRGGARCPRQHLELPTRSTNRIVELPRRQAAGSWGSSGADPGQFNQPTAIAAGLKGAFYVADTGNDRVQVLVGK